MGYERAPTFVTPYAAEVRHSSTSLPLSGGACGGPQTSGSPYVVEPTLGYECARLGAPRQFCGPWPALHQWWQCPEDPGSEPSGSTSSRGVPTRARPRRLSKGVEIRGYLRSRRRQSSSAVLHADETVSQSHNGGEARHQDCEADGERLEQRAALALVGGTESGGHAERGRRTHVGDRGNGPPGQRSSAGVPLERDNGQTLRGRVPDLV